MIATITLVTICYPPKVLTTLLTVLPCWTVQLRDSFIPRRLSLFICHTHFTARQHMSLGFGGGKRKTHKRISQQNMLLSGLTTARGTQSPNPRVTLGPWGSGDRKGRCSLESRLRPRRPHSWSCPSLDSPTPTSVSMGEVQGICRGKVSTCLFLCVQYLFILP